MSRTKNEAQAIPTGKQIKKAMIDLDLRPFDLAQDLGVSVLYIRMITNEKRAAKDMRKKIAKRLAMEYRKNGYPLPAWAKTSNKKEQTA